MNHATNTWVVPVMGNWKCRHATGQIHYTGTRGEMPTLVEMPIAKVTSSLFWWVHRFSDRQAVFEIGYGDKEFLLTSHVCYPSEGLRFGTWELLHANTTSDPSCMSGSSCVWEIAHMESTIAQIAAGLENHWSQLRSPDPDIIDRALTCRGQRLHYDLQQQRLRDSQKAVNHASHSFRQGDFAEVIRLLEPFETDPTVPKSAHKILKMARKRIVS